MKKTISGVDNLADLNASDARKVLIGGQLVFATMQATMTPPKGFVPQIPRDAAGGLLAAFKKDVPKVYVYLNPALFDLTKKRFALAIDSYLAWGMRQRKGEVALIGGIEHTEGSIHVDVLVFQGGRLVALYDRELPDRQNVRFRIAVEAIIAQVRADYPDAKIKQAAPLENWAVDGVDYVGEDALRHVAFRPLAKSTKSNGSLLVPAGIAAAGILFNFGMIGVAWNKFVAAEDRFTVAFSSPEVKAAGGVDSDYISVMTQRRTFMESPRRQDVLPAKVLQIVRGIGVLPGVQIIELQLPAPGISGQPVASAVAVNADDRKNLDLITADRVADAQIRISVPRVDTPALEQAKVVLSTLAGSTGMSLRLTQRGYQDDPDKKRRIFTIEGFVHG